MTQYQVAKISVWLVCKEQKC